MTDSESNGPSKYYLQVGLTEDETEIVINHIELDLDENGAGYMIFSEDQARNLAMLLLKKVAEVQNAKRSRQVR